MLNRYRPDQDRYARRMARIARWDRPLEGGLDRLRAYANMILNDHGIVRLIYLNAHKVTDRFWRAAQPAPHQIAALARKAKLKTIVTLRGGREYGSWPLEKETAERLGLKLVDFVLRSRAAPDKETLLSLERFFETTEYPILVHCKSGADRAGFMAALYMLIVEKTSADEALKQLHLRYGHMKFAKTGVLDRVILAYRDEGEAKGKSFLQWVEQDYDPAAIEAAFKPGFWSNFLTDRVLHRE